jgi:hypothetical protein
MRLIGRWLPSWPYPVTETDRRARFGWAFSVRQIEIADTAVFDQPTPARAWFETAIRDHIDLGRPDKVKVVFGRKLNLRGKNQTPGSFSTSVITPGTRARIEIRYKGSGAKAYFKEGRALRVETTINNPDHLGLHKTLNAGNWRALRRAGEQINDRFLAALGQGSPGLPHAATLATIVLPTIHDGQRAPGLRFGEPRVMALLASIASFEHVTRGLTNRAVRDHMVDLYRSDYNVRQATYDLRRLRLKGLIERIAATHTYRVTTRGRAVATFFVRLAARVVIPVLTELDATSRPPRGSPLPLVIAWRAYDRELVNTIKAFASAA